MNKKIVINDGKVLEVGDSVIIPKDKIVDLNIRLNSKDLNLRNHATMWTVTGEEVYLSKSYNWVIGEDETGYLRLYALEK